MMGLKKKSRLLGVFTLFFAVALGLGAMFSSGAKVEAENKSVKAVSLFTACEPNGVGTVEFESAAIGDTGANGVKVIKKGGGAASVGGKCWSYDINGSFIGDGKIEYAFVNASSMEEAVSFIVKDTSGSRVLTAFVAPASYENKSANFLGGVFAESDYATKPYKVSALNASYETEEITFNLFDQGVANGSNLSKLRAIGGALPKFGQKNALALRFKETSLCVNMLAADGNEKTFAEYAYAEYPEMGRLKESGYKITIADGQGRDWALLRNWAAQPPSVLSIDGIALNTEDITLGVAGAGIVYSGGESFDGENNTIELNKGDGLSPFSYTEYYGFTLIENGAAKGEFRVDGAENSSEIKYINDLKDAEYGEYGIEVSGRSGSKTYKAKVGRGFDELFVPSARAGYGTVKIAARQFVGANAGVKLQKIENGGAHGGTGWYCDIDGLFTGEGEIRFVAPVSGGANIIRESVSFVVKNAKGQNALLFFYVPGNGLYHGGVVATSEYVKGKTFPVHTLKRTAENALKKAEVTLSKGYFLPNEDKTAGEYDEETKPVQRLKRLEEGSDGFLAKAGEKQRLVIRTDGNGASVLADAYTAESGTPVLTEIAYFSYADYPELETLKTDGYKITIADGLSDTGNLWHVFEGWSSDSPYILSICGEALDGKTAKVTFKNARVNYQGETEESGKALISLDETDDLAGFAVSAEYTIGGGLSFGTLNTSARSSEEFASRAVGDYALHFTYGGIEKEYLVRVQPNVPQLYLSGAENYQTVIKSENGAWEAKKSDVEARDKKEGVLADSAISIFVKAPTANDFVPYDSFSFNAEDFGLYTIKYVAENSYGKIGSIERYVRYVKARPQITLNGEIPKTAYTGKTISLPTPDVNAEITVVCNGNAVEVKNLSFVPLAEGEYSVVYSYTDENGITAAKSATIAVIDDKEAPVITIEDGEIRLKKGEKLIAPRATATDNADGEVSVTVEIFFGGEKAGENEIIADRVGIYTIAYTAEDEAGNKTVRYIEAFAGAAGDSDAVTTDKESNSKVIVIAVCIAAGVAAVSVVAVVAIKCGKKKRKESGDSPEKNK